MNDTIKVNEHKFEGAIASLEFILNAIQAINEQDSCGLLDPLYFNLKFSIEEVKAARED